MQAVGTQAVGMQAVSTQAVGMLAVGMQAVCTMEVGALLALATEAAATTVVVGMPPVGITIKIRQLKWWQPMPQETCRGWQNSSQTQSHRLKLPRTTRPLWT